MLDNTPSHPSTFRTKNWIEKIADSRGTHNTSSQIKFKTSVLKSSLWGYTDAYILVKETVTVPNTADACQETNNNNIEIVFRNCAPFTDCIAGINHT